VEDGPHTRLLYQAKGDPGGESKLLLRREKGEKILKRGVVKNGPPPQVFYVPANVIRYTHRNSMYLKKMSFLPTTPQKKDIWLPLAEGFTA
jgi:hypothetical protein